MAKEDFGQNPESDIDRDQDELMEQEGGDRDLEEADDAGIGADEDDDEFDDTDEDADDEGDDADVDE
jgi:hypothetical protein